MRLLRITLCHELEDALQKITCNGAQYDAGNCAGNYGSFEFRHYVMAAVLNKAKRLLHPN